MKIDHPDMFKSGYRIIMRTWRSKDGGPNDANRPAIKHLTSSVDEFNEQIRNLNANRFKSERIYSTVDSRDLKAALREFKRRQLDADYGSEEQLFDFYRDVKNRWVSCLADTQARETRLFLIDCDDESQKLATRVFLNNNPSIPVHHDYATKNGHHFITSGFDPSLLKGGGEVKKNAMMLWAWD